MSSKLELYEHPFSPTCGKPVMEIFSTAARWFWNVYAKKVRPTSKRPIAWISTISLKPFLYYK
jgi:hypothetical protein